jgi:O-antigen/teichoic acid export membrane protein
MEEQRKNPSETYIEPNYKKDGVVTTIANIGYLFALWIMTVLTPIYSTMVAAGIFSLALSVSNICDAVATYNITAFYSSDVKKTYSDSEYFIFRTMTTTISAFLCLILAFSFGYTGETLLCVLVYYVYKIAEKFSTILYLEMQRAGKYYLAGYSLIGKSILSLLAFWLMIWLSKSLLFSLLVLSIVGIAFLMFVDIPLAKHFNPEAVQFSKSSLKTASHLFIAVLPLFFAGFVASTIPSFPRIVFDQNFGDESLGFFASMSAITILIQAAIDALLVPFTPKFAFFIEKKDKKNFIKIILVFCGLAILLTLVAFLLVIFLGDWLLKLLYTKSDGSCPILEYSYIFKWIVLATGLSAIAIILSTTLISLRYLKPLWISAIIAFAAMITSSYLLIPNHFMYGILGTLFISYGVEVICFAVSVSFGIHKRFSNGQNDLIVQ